MPAFDYNKAQVAALALVQKFGQSVTLSKVVSTYEPVLMVQVVTTVTNSDAWVVALPASSGAAGYDDTFVADLRKGKNRLFYLAAKGLAFTPEAGNLLTYQGGVWELVGVTPLDPAGTPLIFTMGAKPSNFSAIPTVPD